MKKDNEWGFYTLPTQTDPEKRAIERLKIASEMSLKNYGTPLVVTTSGGKDSSVCVELAQRAKENSFCVMEQMRTTNIALPAAHEL